MRPIRQDDPSITHKACEWLFALTDADAATQAEFGAWLRESPRHVEEFLLVSAAFRELDHVAADDGIDIDTLRSELAVTVMPLCKGATRPARSAQTGAGVSLPRSGRRFVRLAAAVAGLIVGGWLLWAAHFGGQNYSTAVGEIRSFELADGSVIELNTRSRMKVRFSGATRDVELLAGEALFKVARDPGRPFRVHAGSAVIQAVGTQFNVYRRAQVTTVSVIEGVVRVSEEAGAVTTLVPADAQMLVAGHEARIGADGHVMKLVAADTAKAIAWRERRLIFNGDRLVDVAAEFNRYNSAPHLRVDGAIAQSKQLAGIFDADDPESLLLFLADLGDVSVERDGDEVIIRSADAH